jgi:hypothetical protein
MAEYSFALDATHTAPFDMRVDTASLLTDILRENKELVTSDDYLRKSLRDEADPRKFFLLHCLASGFRASHGGDYIDECRHMLFEEGRVVKPLGPGKRTSFYGSVSHYTYECILAELKRSGSSFSPQNKGLSHEVKIAYLDEWLSTNRRGKNGKYEKAKASANRVSPKEGEKTKELNSVKGSSSSQALWLVCLSGVMLACGIFFWRIKLTENGGP